MTPKELYPIGTQLITRRLSQAALAHELGFLIETQASNGGFYPSFDFGFDASGLFHFDTWRVTVTKENQKWLSPVPMVGDLMFPTGEFAAMVKDPNFGYWHSRKRKIIQRIYPNNQRAPMLEWDEVILPTKGELS